MPTRKVVAFKRKKKSYKAVFFYSLLGVLIFFIFLNFGKNLLVQYLNPVGYLEWQVIEEGIKGEGYLFKKEVLVYAQASGIIKTKKTWSKVRKGDIVLEIEDTSNHALTKMKAPMNGIFVPVTDGLEFIGPDNLENINPEKIFQLYKPTVLGNEVVEGQPVGKIIDNLDTVILALPGVEKKGLFREGQDYQIKINDDLEVKAEFLRFSSGNALFSLPFYPDELLKLRKVKVFVNTSEKGGFLVPKSALRSIANKTYLYTLKNEEVVLTPVKIIKNFENNVLVEGEKESKDELLGKKYLIRPFLVRPGDKIYINT
ncbi:HlyD family efflux transporter periplasmic adaptor subunit [Carboxydothermus pertinax]|uniref:Membrane fusion protein n=1 Tax=Carboxydothermus pertinax TaxID=870242 RepID=A0A1L8CSA3_9THEO|nr:HlyD family efflux transporter periplasmic adaptor subunit [Carboxydothermus pertinax]GAV21800.1 hypothetical protein cpu_03100 [Carboxydothermus pertinax]